TLDIMRKNHVRGWPAFTEPPAINNIAAIKAPTLIVHGDKDLPYITETSKYLESNVPGARRVVIPGTGHMLNLEDPKAFNKAVLDFLKQHK
ncbi:MAG TPA: alpha/beta hydrolase, partial [Chitinophagaceae bacterium]|nr:alpha/beta hydrolase [Chitinophagaceae bacterium]